MLGSRFHNRIDKFNGTISFLILSPIYFFLVQGKSERTIESEAKPWKLFGVGSC